MNNFEFKKFCLKDQAIKSNMGFLPFLDDLLSQLSSTKNQDSLIQFCLFFGAIFYVLQKFVPIPYGKSYTPGRFKIEIKDRVAYILCNFFGPFLFVYSQCSLPNGHIFSVPSVIFTIHYFHRIFIYSWFRKSSSRPWPLYTFLYYLCSNTLFGLLTSFLLIFSGKTFHIALQILLGIVILGFAVVAAIHDYKLCSLRHGGQNGYQIPNFFLFKWVSGPNYFLEIIEWLLFTLYLPFNLGAVAYVALVLANISGKAEWNHDAYIRIFKNKYPKDRAPWIPFIQNSRWFA